MKDTADLPNAAQSGTNGNTVTQVLKNKAISGMVLNAKFIG